MDVADLAYFREALLKQKEEILAESNKTLNEEVHHEKEGIPDAVDRSSMETDRSFTLRLRDRERKLLKKVDEAIDRLEKKSFGLCFDCGDTIGMNRLKARPVATLCIECKEIREKNEKLKSK